MAGIHYCRVCGKDLVFGLYCNKTCSDISDAQHREKIARLRSAPAVAPAPVVVSVRPVRPVQLKLF